jgi:hypothetical protein
MSAYLDDSELYLVGTLALSQQQYSFKISGVINGIPFMQLMYGSFDF